MPSRLIPIALLALSTACEGLQREAAESGARSDAFARSTIELLRTRGLAGVRPRLSADALAYPQMEQRIAAMVRELPAGEPDSVANNGGSLNDEDGHVTGRLVYVVYAGSAASEVQVDVEEIYGRQLVTGLRVTRLR